MTGPTTFRESTAQPRVQAVPLAHLSIELGHMYVDDLSAGVEGMQRHFRRVAPWAAAAREVGGAAVPGRGARVSTCFLIDDYLAPLGSPQVVIPELIQAAAGCGLEIDYLARESGCVEAGGESLAHLVEERIVPDPPPETTGVRPPLSETGWLCNGQRSPSNLTVEAMEPDSGWRPPAQSAARRHSVFVDVELWDERGGTRTWSCSFLAAVWQLLRLGLLRSHGARVAVPAPWPGELPDRWEDLPAIIALRPGAAPFCAYRSLSILPNRFLANEHAVRTILSQVAIESEVARQVLDRSQAEGISLPAEAVDRIEYVFTSEDAPPSRSVAQATGTPAPSPRAGETAPPGS